MKSAGPGRRTARSTLVILVAGHLSPSRTDTYERYQFRFGRNSIKPPASADR